MRIYTLIIFNCILFMVPNAYCEGIQVSAVRVYADSTGESHFEEITIDLTEYDYAPPAPLIYVSPLMDAARYGYISVAPGWFGDWHPSPKRQLMIYISGEIEAEVSDGEVRRFGPGSITVVEDTTGRGHTSRAVGDAKVVIVVIHLEE